MHDSDHQAQLFFSPELNHFFVLAEGRERGIMIKHGGGAGTPGREHEPVLTSDRRRTAARSGQYVILSDPIRSRAEEEAEISREMRNGCGTRGGRRRE